MQSLEKVDLKKCDFQGDIDDHNQLMAFHLKIMLETKASWEAIEKI